MEKKREDVDSLVVLFPLFVGFCLGFLLHEEFAVWSVLMVLGVMAALPCMLLGRLYERLLFPVSMLEIGGVFLGFVASSLLVLP